MIIRLCSGLTSAFFRVLTVPLVLKAVGDPYFFDDWIGSGGLWCFFNFGASEFGCDGARPFLLRKQAQLSAGP